MIRKIFYAGIATAALMIGAAHATETIVWWDFLSGGDGVRMKTMIDEFNKEHEGKIDASTFDWDVPFYTKVQTSAAVGQGPDVMTYHESRMPLGVSTGTLSPLTAEELAASGVKASDFGPANWKAAQGPDGKQYAVPLDIHSIDIVVMSALSVALSSMIVDCYLHIWQPCRCVLAHRLDDSTLILHSSATR